MKKTLTSLALAIPLAICVAGCDATGDATSVTEGAKRSAIDEYKALVEADEAAMNAAPPPDAKKAPAVGAKPAAKQPAADAKQAAPKSE